MLAGDERKADQIAQGVGHGDNPWLIIPSHCVRSSVLRFGFRLLSVLSINNTALDEKTFILLRCVPNPFSCQDTRGAIFARQYKAIHAGCESHQGSLENLIPNGP